MDRPPGADADTLSRGGAAAREGLICAGLVLLVLVAYLASLGGALLWDDTVIITDNAVLRMPDGLQRIWRGEDVVDYFPLTYSLFWVQYQLFENAPAGYHLVTIVLHALGVVLVYAVLRRLNVPAAAFAAALFAVHPLVGTSVMWISEQKNTLSLVLYAASTLAFTALLPSPPSRRAFVWWLVSLALFTLALLAKPSGVGISIFFALLGLAHGWTLRRAFVTVLPFLLLCLLVGVGTIWYQHFRSAAGAELVVDPWGVRLAVAGWNVLFYARMLLLPLRQSMVYPFWTPDVTSVAAWLPDLFIVGLAIGLWRVRARTGPLPLLGVAYVLLTLAPVLGFVPITYMRYARVADHLAYLAAVGVLALYASLADVAARRMAPALRGVAGAVCLGLLLWLDQGRCAALATREQCWRDVIAAWPEVWVAYGNLGSELIAQGRQREAIPVLEEQARLQPDEAGAYYNLGVAWMALEAPQEAVRALRQAIRLEPRHAMAHNNLGLTWRRLGAYDDALRELSLAARLEPSNAEFQNNAGLLLLDLNRPEAALGYFDAALARRPGVAKVMEARVQALLRLGRTEEAVAQARSFVRQRPQDAAGHALLGALLIDGGDRAGAVEALQQALRARTADARVLNDVGLLAARLDEHLIALKMYEKAQKLDSRFLLAINNQAWLLATCDDVTFRNGAAARECMARVWAVGKADDPQLLDTDAAVWAEQGDMARARDQAAKALSIARDSRLDVLAADIARHLKRYQSGLPWRE